MKTIEYYVDLLKSKGFEIEYISDGDNIIFTNNEIDPNASISILLDVDNISEADDINSYFSVLTPISITFNNLKHVPINFYSEDSNDYHSNQDKNIVFLNKNDIYLFEYVLDIITNVNSLLEFIKKYNSEFSDFIRTIETLTSIIEKHGFLKNKDYSICCKHENIYKTIGDSLVINYKDKTINENGTESNLFFIFESLTWKKYLKIKNDYFGDPVTIDLNKDFNIIDLINVLSNK